MLQLKNQTPFAADFVLLPNEAGIDTLYMMVKATFNIGSKWTLAEEQLPLQKVDEYFGEPESSSLMLASDCHIGKSVTDVVMVGDAVAVGEAKVFQLDVSLVVGALNKTVRVFGDRHWDRGCISSPEPFVTMPLVYERAYGGVYADNDQVISAEARNPVGRGFYDKRGDMDIDGSSLPNLECPTQLMSHYLDVPSPTGFGPVAPYWQPRASYAGTYDDEWKNTRAPYLPDDYSSRFMNSAAADLQYPGFLKGGEPVEITGMHARGKIQFNLPQIKLVNNIQMSGQEYSTPFVLDTLQLNPNHLQLSMIWRSAFACDKKALKIEQLGVSLSR